MDTIKDREDDGDLLQLTPCSATDALRREPQSIEVDDESELVLSPTRRMHHRHFARVQLRGFTDLQALGLVPRKIKEQAVRSAIASDDEQALRIATEQLRARRPSAHEECGCHGRTSQSVGDDLASLYREVRHDYHPALARVLSEHYGVELAWNSTVAASTKRWVSNLSRESMALVAILQDITIGRRAKLILPPASRSLLARSIRIHREGQLVHRGAYLRIWANSIDSYLDVLSELVTQAPIWALNR